MPFAPLSLRWKAFPGKRSGGKRLSPERSKDSRRGKSVAVEVYSGRG
jgi:hypothetical protein